MSIRVKADLDKFDSYASDAKLQYAQKHMADNARRAMEKYVPKLSGNLRMESVVSNDGSHITYSAPYAREQFYGVINGSPVKNYSTPGTGKRWDLALKANTGDMDKVKRVFYNALKKGS